MNVLWGIFNLSGMKCCSSKQRGQGLTQDSVCYIYWEKWEIKMQSQWIRRQLWYDNSGPVFEENPCVAVFLKQLLHTALHPFSLWRPTCEAVLGPLNATGNLHWPADLFICNFADKLRTTFTCSTICWVSSQQLLEKKKSRQLTNLFRVEPNDSLFGIPAVR